MKKTFRFFKKRDAHNPIKPINIINPNTHTNMRQNDSITEASEAAILKFYTDFCDYMTHNFNADPEELMLDWNCVGATARFIAKGRNIQYRLWERSEGHIGIPDMTAIVYEFALAPTGNTEEDQDTILRLHGDLAYMAYTAGFHHYAFIRNKPFASPKQVPGCEVACIPSDNCLPNTNWTFPVSEPNRSPFLSHPDDPIAGVAFYVYNDIRLRYNRPQN